ncbi:hypothetical protein D0Z00_003492 [Geotrichum galactomycetum]|uniref:Uncharacterized protein n=1 Tax=Geotrichum galactomycetum TaxID=27317 RepID=A0ACB6V123_9ASCO|nr:hypothetical protein D0Z00_003492 [Geotrichum candidum]
MENVRHTWQRAHKSLQSCPKQFQHPKELMQLKFIGPAICGKLEKRMEKYCMETGVARPVSAPVPQSVAPEKRARKRKAATDPTPLSTADLAATETTTERPKKKRAWVPRYRSGGYAILLTLYHHDSVHPGVGMNKPAIINLASDLCDSSFKSNPNVKAFYSAWNSMQTLIKNEVVYASNSRNGMYYITDDGKALAEKILQAERETKRSVTSGNMKTGTTVTIIPEPATATLPRAALSPTHRRVSGTIEPEVSPNTSVRNKIVQMAPSLLHPNSSPVRASTDSAARPGYFSSTRSETWPAGSYTISLIIDNREVRSSGDRNFFRDELERLGIMPRVEALSVGDAVWIAQHNTTKKVAVIDYILERKRVDDLISSIKDGRFTEQKARLRRSGLTNVIYLVEEPQGINKGPYHQHVQTAMSQAITIDGFHLKRTTTAEESVQFLSKLTKFLRKELYHDKALKVLWPPLTTSKAYLECMVHERQRLPSLENEALAVDFDTFQTALAKSGMLTVRDIYIRMLMTIKGVTIDKAMCIQSVWPTPKLLIDDYKRLAHEESRKAMISDRLGNSITRKKVTRQLSEKIYEVWGKL